MSERNLGNPAGENGGCREVFWPTVGGGLMGGVIFLFGEAALDTEVVSTAAFMLGFALVGLASGWWKSYQSSKHRRW
jgi:hypothetical protein